MCWDGELRRREGKGMPSELWSVRGESVITDLVPCSRRQSGGPGKVCVPARRSRGCRCRRLGRRCRGAGGDRGG